MLGVLSGIPYFVWRSVYGAEAPTCWLLFLERLKFVSLDKISIGQVVVLSGLPILYFYMPGLAPVYLPMLCTALVISRVVQLWDDARLEKGRAEQTKKKDEQTRILEKAFQGFEEMAKNLEEVMALCLGISVEELVRGEDTFNQAIAAVELRVAEKLKRLTGKIRTLVDLCTKANREQSTQDLFNAVNESEKRLEDAQIMYEKRVAEFEQINREFHDMKNELKNVIDDLCLNNALLKEKLAAFEKFLNEKRKSCI